ncbi:hypothetical protein STCU_03462 [Strigomonas culicis]|uniref:Uncharacterized protein n=1 Tax=Strigomonas culicis TaxID=28005 RepID=S9W647_9TRYP|nr:hypothetical protein STCU_07005 [Strigomonas culicis]EPY31425.1 hypothetical protein STCU_03462 [Strigomonas culicis]|eukprot:EPY24786.1 hypothetical protein STCU_07005 [Strigomonas culicis]
MEELRKVREAQDELMRRGTGGPHPGLSPAAQERVSQRLADAPVELVDLLPRPVAVSWAARRKMQEGLQSILHPVTGALLNDASAAVGVLPASLYGFRVDGLTLDTSLPAPADVCLLFSFGSLPYQQAGPVRTDSVEKTDVCESFRLTSRDRGGGFVWCEPLSALEDASMVKFKEGSGHAVLYLHVYDALTMFYVATAQLPLAHFHRPYNAECAVAAMDLMLQRDLHMTAEVVPPQVFPMVRQAGQLHLTLFTVGVAPEGGRPIKTTVLHEPSTNTRLIVAKKIKHADKVAATADDGRADAPAPAADAAPQQQQQPESSDDLHRRRVEYLKSTLQREGSGSPALPGVPGAHVHAAEQQADMEYRLRYVENKRDEAKSTRIAKALVQRLTTRVDVLAIAYRPETVQVPFVNPFSTPVQFFVEIDPRDVDVFAAPQPNFTLGPRERASLPLVLRFTADDVARQDESKDLVLVVAKVYTERRELILRVEVSARVSLPLVDRRYELYGAAGTELTKRAISRVFSAAALPAQCSQAELLQRMGDLCCYVATSSAETTVETGAALDAVTQTHLTAWEEACIHTTVPRETGTQRTDYVTLFYDRELSRVYETWEICVYACECVTTREVYWGQTTALGLPADGTEDLYCSNPAIEVTRRGPSYILRVRPREVGLQTALLHTLTQDTLKKTVLTIPAAYPTPTYTQVIELSLAEVRQPVFRRLNFVNHGDLEDVFTVQHNYKFQLRVSPSRFALAPGDSQFVSLQFDMLSLPPGQMEGRWPMWLFINNKEDKTIESYYLQIVVRAHPVVRVV